VGSVWTCLGWDVLEHVWTCLDLCRLTCLHAVRVAATATANLSPVTRCHALSYSWYYLLDRTKGSYTNAPVLSEEDMAKIKEQVDSAAVSSRNLTSLLPTHARVPFLHDCRALQYFCP
jgi:hypothetical protein